jgi:hypothetical protein
MVIPETLVMAISAPDVAYVGVAAANGSQGENVFQTGSLTGSPCNVENFIDTISLQMPIDAMIDTRGLEVDMSQSDFCRMAS